MCTYMHTCVHICIYVRIYAYMHAYIYRDEQGSSDLYTYGALYVDCVDDDEPDEELQAFLLAKKHKIRRYGNNAANTK